MIYFYLVFYPYSVYVIIGFAWFIWSQYDLHNRDANNRMYGCGITASDLGTEILKTVKLKSQCHRIYGSFCYSNLDKLYNQCSSQISLDCHRTSNPKWIMAELSYFIQYTSTFHVDGKRSYCVGLNLHEHIWCRNKSQISIESWMTNVKILVKSIVFAVHNDHARKTCEGVEVPCNLSINRRNSKVQRWGQVKSKVILGTDTHTWYYITL
jgi:hypothetical protein